MGGRGSNNLFDKSEIASEGICFTSPGFFPLLHQYISKYKILGKYLQPFTTYSTKEKQEVPKCQMLAANILTCVKRSRYLDNN